MIPIKSGLSVIRITDCADKEPNRSAGWSGCNPWRVVAASITGSGQQGYLMGRGGKGAGAYANFPKSRVNFKITGISRASSLRWFRGLDQSHDREGLLAAIRSRKDQKILGKALAKASKSY